MTKRPQKNTKTRKRVLYLYTIRVQRWFLEETRWNNVRKLNEWEVIAPEEMGRRRKIRRKVRRGGWICRNCLIIGGRRESLWKGGWYCLPRGKYCHGGEDLLSTGGKYFHGGRRSTGKEVAKLSTDTDMALPLLYYYPVIIIRLLSLSCWCGLKLLESLPEKSN